jgi:phosphate/phosphite/phosphonate ABC transporter binding protein
MFKKSILFIVQIGLIISLVTSCKSESKDEGEIIKIDFSSKQQIKEDAFKTDTVRTINIAVSAIISPRETMQYYKELFDYISKKINYKINLVQRRSYEEVNILLRKNQIDMAFVCSGAYVDEKIVSNIEILVVPVCNGKPFYQAYIITNASSGINKFEDLRGKTFAFTDPLSNTGKLYADKRLNDLNTEAEAFFKSTTYTHAHDVSIQMVAKNIVDGATVDGLIYDYWVLYYPERIKNTLIIERSELFGIPPVVVPEGMDEGLKEKLKHVLKTMHNDPEGAEVLKKIYIEKFVDGNDSNYDRIRQIKNTLLK